MEHMAHVDSQDQPKDRPKKPAPPQRLRFWEIDRFLTCPVVGLCLSLKEQKQILKKAKTPLKGKGEFERHEILVSCGSEKNRISKRIDRLLARKFRIQAEALFMLQPTVFERSWKDFFKDGDIGAALWVAATRSDLSTDFRRQVFGDIHMSMHGNARKECALKARVALQEKKIEKSQKQRKSSMLENRGLKAQLADLTRRWVMLGKELEKSEKRVQALTLALRQGEPASREMKEENRRLADEVQRLEQALAFRDDQLRVAERENAKTRKQMERWKTALPALQAEARDFVRQVLDLQRCDTACPAFDLCRKRILVVGGMSRIASFYRNLIEDVGGIFEYHDGHMKGGSTSLENSLRRADMVLCPVNCNSHTACTLVKKLGKKHNKPVRMLASSSLSALSQALHEERPCAINGARLPH